MPVENLKYLFDLSLLTDFELEQERHILVGTDVHDPLRHREEVVLLLAAVVLVFAQPGLVPRLPIVSGLLIRGVPLLSIPYTL